MIKENCRVGMIVTFGRENGEKTLGEVVKMNPTKAKVKTIDGRGNGRGSIPGTIWGVPYSMMTPETSTPNSQEVPRIKYSPFQNQVEQHILSAIFCCLTALSPENLCCDGEISRSEVLRKQAKLNQQLNGLYSAYGHHVTDESVYDWERQRREYAKEKVNG